MNRELFWGRGLSVSLSEESEYCTCFHLGVTNRGWPENEFDCMMYYFLYIFSLEKKKRSTVGDWEVKCNLLVYCKTTFVSAIPMCHWTGRTTCHVSVEKHKLYRWSTSIRFAVIDDFEAAKGNASACDGDVWWVLMNTAHVINPHFPQKHSTVCDHSQTYSHPQLCNLIHIFNA